MKAATVSGPSISMVASSSPTSLAVKAVSLSPSSAPFQKCGVARWRMPGTGRSKSRWLLTSPVSEAATMVTPW